MSDPDPETATPAASKRPRPVISCLECRRKKLKCSRTHPCQQCVKIGRPGRCEYQAGQEPEPNTEYSPRIPNKRQRLSLSAADGGDGGGLDPSSLDDHVAPRRLVPLPVPKQGVIEDLQERVARLEGALLAQQHRPQQNGESLHHHTSQNATSSWHDASRQPTESESFAKPDTLSSQFGDACSFLEKLEQEPEQQPVAIRDLRTRLADIHYSVELNQHRREQSQQALLYTPSNATYHNLQLPPFSVCEKLAILYFDNLEHCFRILHWPTFREQLQILFTDGRREQACSFGFVPQLVGVLAGAVILGTHQECEAVPRQSPIVKPSRALEYMKDFLDKLQDYERYLLPALQVKMLYQMTGWLNLNPMHELFRINGEILRDALWMKMDQDPSCVPGVASEFEGELRRRVWMTIIEVDLMLSSLCKMPCMVPPFYTTKPPRNINDEEFFPGIEVLPPSRPTTEWTDGLCQYILSQSFPQRLAACRYLEDANNIRPEDVLENTRSLERRLQELPAPLRFNYLGDEASKTPARLMARMELDISIRRPLMHLYSYCALAARPSMGGERGDFRNETRAGFLQSCLMILNYQDLFDPQYSELNVPRPRGYWDFFYNTYRQEIGLSTLGVCLEIRKLDGTNHTDEATPTRVSSGRSSTGNGIPESAARLPTYNKDSLLNAVKDTLEPMTRRLTHQGAQVPDLVYYRTILYSLMPERRDQSRDATILEGLRELADECRVQLHRDGVPITTAPPPPTAIENVTPGADISRSSANGTFDPLWKGFPTLHMFKHFRFDDQPYAQNART